MAAAEWTPYVIAQGEYLTKIAHRLGFDRDTVWNATQNRDLRTTRSNPEVLCPGDVLWIPPPPPPPTWLPVQVGATNTYTATIPTVSVVLTLQEPDGSPIAGQAYAVEGMPGHVKGTTDGGGSVTLRVPVQIHEVVLVLGDGRRFRVAVGHMDPIAETSGVLKRLAHLGYLTLCDDVADDDFELRLALSNFQKDEGLPVTGDCDDATRQALAGAHGS